MHEFIAKHHDQIAGTLVGFDRLVFRGTLRSIVHDVGMQHYLRANHILLKEFAAHVDQVTRRLKEASLARSRDPGAAGAVPALPAGEQGGNRPRHRGS